MSVRVMGWVWEQVLHPTDKLALLAIADNANDEGKHAYASQQTMAAGEESKTGLAQRTFRDACRHLRHHGWLEWVQQGSEWGTNLYAINLQGGRSCRLGRTECLKALASGPDGRRAAGAAALEEGAADAAKGGRNRRPKAAGAAGQGRQELPPNHPRNHPEEPSENQADRSGRRLRVADHPDAARLCTLLADLIEVNTGQRPNPDQQRWRDAVRLMVTEDGLSVLQIEYLIRWSQANEFWRSNILSTPKLREKRITLIAQIQRERTAAHGSRQRRVDASVAELLDDTGGSP